METDNAEVKPKPLYTCEACNNQQEELHTVKGMKLCDVCNDVETQVAEKVEEIKNAPKQFEANTEAFWQLFNVKAASLAGASIEEIEAQILSLQELEFKIKAFKQASIVALREKSKNEKAEETLRQKLHDREYRVKPLPDNNRAAKAQVKSALSKIDMAIVSFSKINPNPEAIFNMLKAVHPSITLDKVKEVIAESTKGN